MNEFMKSDLKNDMKVVLRNGNERIVKLGSSFYDSGFYAINDRRNLYYCSHISDYTNELTDIEGNRELDIMKVYQPNGHLIWESYELTDKKIKYLKALLMLDFKYLTKNKYEELHAFEKKPSKSDLCWYNNCCMILNINSKDLKKELSCLVSLEDKVPLDIRKFLEINSVEV